MTFNQPFVLTTIEGHFGAAPGDDIWRSTFKIPVPSGDTPSETEVLAFLTAIKTDVQNYCAGSDVAMGSNVYLASLSGAVIGTDGRYLGGGAQATQRYTYGSPVPGMGTSIHPFDVALCLSLKGANARGRGSRGRMYFPARGLAVATTDGRISVAQQTNIVGQGKTLIDAINGHSVSIFGPACQVAVMSALGAGTESTVVAVSVGRKLDHMGSRESKLSESHNWVDLTSTREAVERERERVAQLMRG